jgi:hypothetical protein
MTRTRLALAVTLTATGYVVYTNTPTWLPIIGAVFVVGAVVAWHRFSRTSAKVVRLGERTRRKHGVASTWDVLRYGSAWAVRRKAAVVRPSLRDLNRRQRARLRTAEAGVEL